MISNLKSINGDYVQSMRAARNQLLAESDWTQLPDAQCDKTAWATYRQALRDFPATWKPAETANFPETPA
jgi:hypothetical protein